MPLNLSGKNFLTLLDFTPEQSNYLLDLSRDFKNVKRAGTPHRYLEGKNIVLLFEKTSTRTRCAFEVGGMDLGMGVTYLDPGSSQMGKKESIEDTARVLGRMYDGSEFRGFAQDDVEELAAKSGVPVWNGLTTEWHPTQMLADILTVQENFNYDIKGKTLVFMGDCKNNVARSLMVVCSKLGMNFVACGPEECMPADDVIEACKPLAEANGCATIATGSLAGSITVLTDCRRRAGGFGIPLEAALKAATINPARSVGLDREIGSLACGKQADILVLDRALSLRNIVLNGELQAVSGLS